MGVCLRAVCAPRGPRTVATSEVDAASASRIHPFEVGEQGSDAAAAPRRARVPRCRVVSCGVGCGDNPAYRRRTVRSSVWGGSRRECGGEEGGSSERQVLWRVSGAEKIQEGRQREGARWNSSWKGFPGGPTE